MKTHTSTQKDTQKANKTSKNNKTTNLINGSTSSRMFKVGNKKGESRWKNIGHNKRVGILGEDVAVVFLEKHGFSILERNYRNKIGEIDIIAQKDNLIYVFEVKTSKINLKLENIDSDNLFNPNVSIIRDGDGESLWFKPEMNLTPLKINKLKKIAALYSFNYGIKEEFIRFMGVCVTLYYDGSRVTRESLLSCKVRALPLI